MADDTQQLGKYRILEELGRGGFATVYRALDTTLEREVALKLLDPLLMRDENWVARFHREAKAVARLKHPHIVTVYEIGEVKDRIYIAMELVAGGSLKERVADQGPFSWEAALPLAAQVAAALDEAHGQGILHRDLKPGNVLLDPKAGAVLTDFGFARIVGESSMSVSLSGGVVGTPAYIAPEVWDGKETTVQTDLYALACVVYEMVTGEVLFGGETPSVVMRKHLIDGPRFPAQWPAGVPGGVEDVLRQALAREPGQRHGSAGQMMAALQALTPPPAPSAAPRAGERVQEEARPERPLTSPPGPSPSPRERGEPPLRGEGERGGEGKGGLLPSRLFPWAVAAAGLLALLAAIFFAATLGPRLWAALFPEPTPVASAAAPTATPSPVPPSATPTATPVPPPTFTPAPTAVPAPAPGDTWVRPADGMVMVYVPGGEFEMGSTDGHDDEQPVHTVTLDGYWIDRTEVTVAQFRAFVQATGHETTAEEEGWAYAWVESAGEWQQVNGADWQHPQGPDSSAEDDHPVVQVSWYDVAAYCAWAGGELPTEAQWEYAARGPEGLVYPWGNSFDGARLNYCDAECPTGRADSEYNDGYELTAPVGSYPAGASWVGVLDMAGNVWEWVADWYGEYPSGRQVNPTGPSSGDYRVLRGGSWGGEPGGARAAFRGWGVPDYRYVNYGFRCARSSE